MPVSRLRSTASSIRPVRVEDLGHQPRVFEVVVDEALRVVAIEALDLEVAVVAGDQLAAPEQRLRRGLELVVLQADEGAAHQRERRRAPGGRR